MDASGAQEDPQPRFRSGFDLFRVKKQKAPISIALRTSQSWEIFSDAVLMVLKL